MPRVIGIDPGTVSIDVCGLDDGHVFLDRSVPTRDALSDPATFVALLSAALPLDLVAGPSGYGLPLVRGRDATDADLRLAFLATPGEAGEGGIGGMRAFARVLAHSALPLVFTPGVIHLATVPAYRKVNRIDMGTAEKVGVAALAIHDACRRKGARPEAVSIVLIELGGAFTAVLAIRAGQIVDGIGGTAGPLGVQAPGQFDGEVAFLAGAISKRLLFHGGASAVAGWEENTDVVQLGSPRTEREALARDALVEQTVKAAAAMAVSVAEPCEFVLSGRVSAVESIRAAITDGLLHHGPTHVLRGSATTKQGAEGTALLADGLVGGSHENLVERLGLRKAHGSVLDYLYVITPTAARARLGIPE